MLMKHFLSISPRTNCLNISVPTVSGQSTTLIAAPNPTLMYGGTQFKLLGLQSHFSERGEGLQISQNITITQRAHGIHLIPQPPSVDPAGTGCGKGKIYCLVSVRLWQHHRNLWESYFFPFLFFLIEKPQLDRFPSGVGSFWGCGATKE